MMAIPPHQQQIISSSASSASSTTASSSSHHRHRHHIHRSPVVTPNHHFRGRDPHPRRGRNGGIPMDPPEMKLDSNPNNGNNKNKNSYSPPKSGSGGARLTSRRGSTGYVAGPRHSTSSRGQPLVSADAAAERIDAAAAGGRGSTAAATASASRARSRGRRRATVMPESPVGFAPKTDGGDGSASGNVAAVAVKGGVEKKDARSRRHSVCFGNNGNVNGHGHGAVSKTSNDNNNGSHHNSSSSRNMNHTVKSISKSRRHSVVHGNVANQIAHTNNGHGNIVNRHNNGSSANKNGNKDDSNDANNNYHSSRRASVANVNNLQDYRLHRRRSSSHKPPSNGRTLLSREELKLLQLQSSFRSSTRGNHAVSQNESELYMSFMTRYSDEVGVGMGMGGHENAHLEGGDKKQEKDEHPRNGYYRRTREGETKDGVKKSAVHTSRSPSRKPRSPSRPKQTTARNERSSSFSASHKRRLHTASKHYELGDDWDDAFPYDMILPPPKKYESKEEERKQRQRVLESVKTLQLHDFVFVKRSNGKWSYGIVAGKSLESEMTKNRKKGKSNGNEKDGSNHNINKEGNNNSGNDHDHQDETNNNSNPNAMLNHPISFHSASNSNNKHHDQEAILVVVSNTGATKTIPKSHWGVLLRKARVQYDDPVDCLSVMEQEADETERGISVAVGSSSSSSSSSSSKGNSDDGSASGHGSGKGSGIDKSDQDNNDEDIPKCIQIGQSNDDPARLMQKQPVKSEEERAASQDQQDEDQNNHQEQYGEGNDNKRHEDDDGGGQDRCSDGDSKQRQNRHRDSNSTNESREHGKEEGRENDHRPEDPPTCDEDHDHDGQEKRQVGEDEAEKDQEEEVEREAVLAHTEPELSRRRSRRSREDHHRCNRHYQQEHDGGPHYENRHERHQHQGNVQENEEECIIDPYTLTDTNNLEGRTITLQEKDFDDDVSELYGDHWHSAWGEERKRKSKLQKEKYERAKESNSYGRYRVDEVVNLEEADDEDDHNDADDDEDDDGVTEAQEDFNKMQLLHQPSNRNLKQDRSLRTHILKEHRSSLRLVKKQQTKYGGYDNDEDGGDETMGKNVNNNDVDRSRGSGSGELLESNIVPVMPCEVEALNFADELRRSQESTPTTNMDVSDSSSYSSC
mmetsp:Transcript_28338/g.59973  ORF Transcript_28338/g.59973 Transcript_28338/m.59973 type:complete len:1141 (+) Transcript_28338:143-3565(+)